MLQKRNFIISGILVFLTAGSLLIQDCSPKSEKKEILSDSTSFVGSTTCKTCHAKEFADWQLSDHMKSMLPASDSSVLGNFNNQSFTADGVTNKFFKKDGKFYINTQDGEGKYTDMEVKYTFGYYPLQQYLIEFPGGKMQATRASWDSKNKKWFHQYPGQKFPPHDWMHWTGNAQNWNTMCAACHSTNLQKNYDIEKDTYHTKYNEVNVTCENCHGGGRSHLDYINGDYKKGNKIPGSMIKMGKGIGQLAQINNCAPCHARASSLTSASFNPGAQSDELMDQLIPEIPSDEHYHADGQANDEDYIYTSFLESKMFRHGIKCSNCHNPHTGKTIFPGNNMCMNCHAPTYNQPSHTFHQTGSTGSECKNCHMPGKEYMGNDIRFDHTFRAPRPDLSVQYGTPNACNNCHKDKTAKWAADAVVKNYGPKRKYHFAEDLIPGSKQDDKAESHLLKIMNDTSAPTIIQATAAHYLRSHVSQKSLGALLKALNDGDAQIRFRSLKSLDAFDPNNWINNAAVLLTDKVRAVRIAAAELFNSLPKERIPAERYQAFTNAKKELEQYLYYQADFAVGNVMLGDYFLKQKDYSNTEKFYLRALKKDSTYNYVRTNMSAAYNAMGRNEDALKILQEALKVDPKNENIYYNLALLYFEMNKNEESEKNFAKAMELNSPNPRVYYNYGLLLEKKNAFSKAEAVFQKGLTLAPLDASLNYALSLMYLQTGKTGQAIAPASVLKKYYPANAEFQELFQKLRL